MSTEGYQQLSQRLRYSLQNVGWRKSVTSLSAWLRGTTTATKTEEAACCEEGGSLTDSERDGHRQQYGRRRQPKLPVPELQHTLTRYVETLEPILNETQFKRSVNAVQQFGVESGQGERLQKMLFERTRLCDNWAYDWWLDDMYLNNRAALPINSNPGMVWPPRNMYRAADMANFAAGIVGETLRYKQIVDNDELPIDMATYQGKKEPLCMAQYQRLFTSYRRPAIPKDMLMQCETEYTRARPHITVACRQQFYVVHLTKGENAELLTEDEIASQLLFVLEMEETKEQRMDKSPTQLPVGILTGLKRDTWATLREQLVKDETNRQNVSLIEKSMLIVCFDMEPIASSFNSEYSDNDDGDNKSNPVKRESAHATRTRDETSMAHQMLHGCGSASNSGNRWFDKTIQLIVSSDGVNGLCYEHSPAEGVAVINATETVLERCEKRHNNCFPGPIASPSHPTTTTESKCIGNVVRMPEKLIWNFTHSLTKEIEAGKLLFDSYVQDLDFKVYRFNGYGKNFIKSCRCSPDAYIQLALQLAYYKLYRRLCATYESASTRRFLFGRVDCIRANTIEALKWVAAMHADADVKSSSSPQQRCTKDAKISAAKATSTTHAQDDERRLQLFDEAIRKQSLITAENISGHGIDVHLLGLRECAKDASIQAEIFQDEAYSIANHFSLSTSQVATRLNAFMGYGPVVPDGYGASYNPRDYALVFCISSFRSNAATSTAAFTHSLRSSLNQMKSLLEHRTT